MIDCQAKTEQPQKGAATPPPQYRVSGGVCERSEHGSREGVSVDT